MHLPLMFVYPETMQVSSSCRWSFRLMCVCRAYPGNYYSYSIDMQEVITALHGHITRCTCACSTQATAPSGLTVSPWELYYMRVSFVFK